MCVACPAFRLFSCATPASVATIPSKIKNKNKNINIKRKGAGCVVPARLCSPAVVHHQLLGASGLPISHTQPQLRPDPNQEWEGKHEVARSSICALTPSAIKPPLPLLWLLTLPYRYICIYVYICIRHFFWYVTCTSLLQLPYVPTLRRASATRLGALRPLIFWDPSKSAPLAAP